MNLFQVFLTDFFLLFLEVVVDESQAEAEARLWMDTQSHASSSSSDTQEGDCWLGYPTSFCTQFKVRIK